MSIRVNLRGMIRLIQVDTLRRVHTVGFIAGRLILGMKPLPPHLFGLKSCIVTNRSDPFSWLLRFKQGSLPVVLSTSLSQSAFMAKQDILGLI